MTTIKLKYNSSLEFQDFLFKLRKQYSCVYRFAYNRLFDGFTKKEIYHKILKLNNIELIKSRMINDAIDFSSRLYEKDKKSSHKSIFGSKNNFIQRLRNKISKEDFLKKRLINLYIQGEINYNGNRYFELDILNDKIMFKYSKNIHFDLNLEISKNQLTQLIKLQDLCKEKKSKYTITLNENKICLSFEEIKNENLNLSEKRFVGVDLNPTNIGISVLDSDMNIIDVYDFEFSEIINKIKKIHKSSNSKENKYLNNKLNYEILDISKKISEISKHYKCKFIFIEDLEFKGNKGNNRLLKNLWKRNIFLLNLEKRCNINNQKLFKINPAYSSYIGNLQYDYVDPINSSIEIARRGYECIINKSKKFYPTFWFKESLKHQWKETVMTIIKI